VTVTGAVGAQRLPIGKGVFAIGVVFAVCEPVGRDAQLRPAASSERHQQRLVASPQGGARHRIGVGCTGVHDVERAQRGRHHPACGSHYPRGRHAAYSCSERLHQKRLRHSRSHGGAYGLGGHASDDWSTLRCCMLFQSGSSLPASLAQASPTRSARQGRKAISLGGLPTVAIMSLFRDNQLECRRWTANPGH